MKANKAIFISSIIAIVLCVALVVGTTIAVFTSETVLDISFQAGVLQLNASVSGFKLYSAKEDKAGDLYGSDGKTYKYVPCGNKFINGGSADIKVKSKTLILDGMCPGDKVEFDINVKNDGDMDLKFNAVIALVDQKVNQLYNAMDISMRIGDGNDEMSASYVDMADESPAVRSGWQVIEKDQSDTIHVSLALPIKADNRYQGLAAGIRCTVSAIQNIPNAENFVRVYDAHNKDLGGMSDLAEAVANTPDGGRVELLRSDTNPLNEDIVVDKTISIESGDGELRNINGVRFILKGSNANLTLNTIGLQGDTYFDISQAAGLTIKDCEISATPSRLFDETTRTYLDVAGIVVSNSVQQSGAKLNISGCTFTTSKDGVAVYVNGALDNGSSIVGNHFGDEEFAYSTTPVQINSVMQGSCVNIAQNTFHVVSEQSATAFRQLNGAGSYFVAMSQNNVYGATTLASVVGDASVGFADNGSKVNGNDVTFDNLAMLTNRLFWGINAAFSGNTEITNGTFKLGSALTTQTFRDNYVESGRAVNVIE